MKPIKFKILNHGNLLTITDKNISGIINEYVWAELKNKKPLLIVNIKIALEEYEQINNI